MKHVMIEPVTRFLRDQCSLPNNYDYCLLFPVEDVVDICP